MTLWLALWLRHAMHRLLIYGVLGLFALQLGPLLQPLWG